ncbi:alpha/beta fold hydrolase [Croceicoccus sp. Ery5]|uniref:alpha/beta fold hydrolase n=1 Tax=Croceicoccus sp. Ery5 TaxID=1703340 RepID=UPI001E34166D|nr:alpha/beta hydrolase [Croceicoccus sp. Ery5]
MDHKAGGLPKEQAEPQTELWQDGWWESADGLKLHYRDYPARGGDAAALPVICIPGLTRNARDFEQLAQDLSAERRVICIELRGRGESEYARDPASYVPMQYVADLDAFFAQTGIERAIFFGTSLGGIVTMLSALSSPQRIAGAMLNDIGPVIEREGLDHILEYVGHGRSFPTWMHAGRALQEVHGAVHPSWGIEQWIGFAKQLMELSGSGNIRFDYDMRIAEAFATGGNPARDSSIIGSADLWPAYDALQGRPVLVVHGETSDILSGTVAREMVGRIPNVELVSVPETGHTPTLNEPHVRQAIDRLIARSH